MERTDITKNAQQLYIMTADDLTEHTREIVRETVEMLMADKDTADVSTQSDMLTAKEAIATLRISQTTLWKLEKKGKLIPVRIGRRIFFRRDSIERIKENEK